MSLSSGVEKYCYVPNMSSRNAQHVLDMTYSMSFGGSAKKFLQKMFPTNRERQSMYVCLGTGPQGACLITRYQSQVRDPRGAPPEGGALLHLTYAVHLPKC